MNIPLALSFIIRWTTMPIAFIETQLMPAKQISDRLTLRATFSKNDNKKSKRLNDKCIA